jgi:hypothetical protein
MLSDKFKAALVVEKTVLPVSDQREPASKTMNAICQPVSPPVEQGATGTAVPLSASDPVETPAPGQAAAVTSELPARVAQWLIDEVDPGYQKDVVEEIKRQIFYYWGDQYRTSTLSNDIAEVIAECRPDFEASSSPELTAFYAEWGTKWLLSLTSDPFVICSAVENGLRLAEEQWEQMDTIDSTG